MEIHLGADHRGYELKQQLLDYLMALGHDCVDHGTDSDERVDYPRYAQLVGDALLGSAEAVGVLVCGSGSGIAVAANKLPGVRCAVAWCEHIAEYGRRHNHANALAFSADLQTFTEAKRCLDAYLAAEPESGRHAERVEMVKALERAG